MGYGCPRYELVVVEVAEFYSRHEQSFQRCIDVLHCQLAFGNGLRNTLIYRTTFEVGAGNDSLSCRIRRGVRHSMAILLMEVADGSTIADYNALESPFVAKNALEISGIAATRITIDTLIGAHHFLHVSLLYQCLEGGEISLPKVALGEVLDVEGMAVPFWA